MFAGRNLHHHARHPGIDRSLHIVHHTAGEGKDLRSQISFYNLLNGRGIIGRNHRHTGLDALHTGLGQGFGNANFVILVEGNACLLLAVSQGNIVNFDLIGEMQIRSYFIGKIPGADKPVVSFPRLIVHKKAPHVK
jgi:hypothetical protein